MCSRLQGDETPRYLCKCLFHRFWCRGHFLFQKDFARFIQNAVARPAIAEVHTNRELVSFENHVSIYPNSANLFHCRSPFHGAASTSNIASVSHPAGDRPSHPIWLVVPDMCFFAILLFRFRRSGVENIRGALSIRVPHICSSRLVTNATIAFAIFSPPIDDGSIGFA